MNGPRSVGTRPSAPPGHQVLFGGETHAAATSQATTGTSATPGRDHIQLRRRELVGQIVVAATATAVFGALSVLLWSWGAVSPVGPADANIGELVFAGATTGFAVTFAVIAAALLAARAGGSGRRWRTAVLATAVSHAAVAVTGAVVLHLSGHGGLFGLVGCAFAIWPLIHAAYARDLIRRHHLARIPHGGTAARHSADTVPPADGSGVCHRSSR